MKGWKGEEAEEEYSSIGERVGRQAEERPEGVALVSEGKEDECVELERASNQAGNYLQKQGVKRGERVGSVCGKQERGVVVWAMGVLKSRGSGGADGEVHEGRERVKVDGEGCRSEGGGDGERSLRGGVPQE